MEQVNKRRLRAGQNARPRGRVGRAGSRAAPGTVMYRDPVIRAAVGASHGDDGFSLGVSSALIPERVSDLTQLIPSVDDRCDLPGFDELLQDNEVLVG